MSCSYCKGKDGRKAAIKHPYLFCFPAFTSLHLIATGVSCFLGAGLLSFLVYVYCQRFHKPSQESAVIHPTTPNHLNYKGNTTPKNEKYTPMEFKVGRASPLYAMRSKEWSGLFVGAIVP